MSELGWGWNPPLWGDPSRSIWAPPRFRLRRTNPPRAQPLSLDEVVLHLRLDPEAIRGPEVPLLNGMIAAATQTLEDHAGVAVMRQEWRMTLRHWPAVWGDPLNIPLPPLHELRGVIVNGQGQDLANYGVELDERLPARMYPLAGYWPQIVLVPRQPQGIIIDFSCGHEKPEDVPASLRQALLLAIATWYENRESLQQFTLTPMLEIGWRPLLEPYREAGFA
jgi:uncharacterized phiE125 gp8 family phage protein